MDKPKMLQFDGDLLDKKDEEELEEIQFMAVENRIVYQSLLACKRLHEVLLRGHKANIANLNKLLAEKEGEAKSLVFEQKKLVKKIRDKEKQNDKK